MYKWLIHGPCRNTEFASHLEKKSVFVCELIVSIDFFPQYIFGEFSPDEINQFFVTPRCYVEVRSELTRLHMNNNETNLSK